MRRFGCAKSGPLAGGLRENGQPGGPETFTTDSAVCFPAPGRQSRSDRAIFTKPTALFPTRYVRAPAHFQFVTPPAGRGRGPRRPASRRSTDASADLGPSTFSARQTSRGFGEIEKCREIQAKMRHIFPSKIVCRERRHLRERRSQSDTGRLRLALSAHRSSSRPTRLALARTHARTHTHTSQVASCKFSFRFLSNLFLSLSNSGVMADTAAPVTASPVPSTPAKKAGKAAAAAKKPKVKPTHPKTSEMVNSAIKELKERAGSSLQAIKKYITANYKVDADKLAPFIKKYLKGAVESGALVQTKGKGASGSFKLEAGKKGKSGGAGGVSASGKKPAAKKSRPAAASKDKKSTAAAAGAAAGDKSSAAAKKKPASARKSPSAPPAAAPKSAASKKASPAASKKAAPAKKAAKPKTPTKAKKSAKPPTKKPKAPKPKKAAAAPKKPAAKKAAAKK